MQILRLKANRYRSLSEFEWQPNRGLNCLIGPGDSGKSTVLTAISLLLTSNPAPAASEFDFLDRRVDDEFEVEAVLSNLDEETLATLRVPGFHRWEDGELRGLPDEGDESVLVARVSGSPELEVSHALVPPGGEPMRFTAGFRRRLPFVRIAPGEWAAREFRLGRTSLLAKHIGAMDVQARLQAVIAEASSNLTFPDDVEERLGYLKEVFRAGGLPDDLLLGMITPAGTSLTGLVGLLSGERPDEAIPVAFSGAGTKNLALFRLAVALADEEPVVVFDEPEVGLEPYRQRALIAELREVVGDGGQAFLTTHSPAILEALEPHEVWRVVPGRPPVCLGDSRAADVLREAPAAFLSKLPVLCEGPTEAGLLRPVLDYLAAAEGTPLDALGVHLVARKGQPFVLTEAEALLDMGIPCGVFVDAETDHPGRRSRLDSRDTCYFASWDETGVRNIEEAVALRFPFPSLRRVVAIAAQLQDGNEERLHQQVNEYADVPGKQSLNELANRVGEEGARLALAQAMAKGRWFKTIEGGEALGTLTVQEDFPAPTRAVFEGLWGRLHEGLSL